MKKHILVVVAVLLSSPAFSQVLDYRNVYTGVYQCSSKIIWWNNDSTHSSSVFVVETFGPESEGFMRFTNNGYIVLYPKIELDGSFESPWDTFHYDLTGFFEIDGFSQTFKATEERYGMPDPFDMAIVKHTCTKTAPLTIGEENALNGITMFYGDGLLTIRQPNNSVNRVRIFSIDGKELLNEPVLSSATQIPLTANAGMYLVAFYNNNTFTGSQKLVVR